MMDPARRAYETLAPAYDEFTRTNDYEMWLGDLLLPELEAARAGGIFETTIATADIEPHVHRQRHFTDGDLEAAIAAAGLEQLALLGQRETKARVELHRHADQERDRKVICIARSGRG